jgi:uncharacterized protein (DUF4415 family)
LKKVDRHVIQPHEYDEVPDPKQQITLRLDAAVLRWFQESGPGY